MDAIEGTPDSREQLGQWMDEDRRHLRLKWSHVAQRAGMSAQNLREIRNGTIRVTVDAADRIEDALEWDRGSIRAAVLHGRRPTFALASPGSGSATRPDVVPPDWTEQEEQRWLVARETLEALKLRAGLTRMEWRFMRDEYGKLEAADRARKAHVTPGDRS